ncbi:MAG: zinc-binding dehydrogenase [Thermoplasmatota archaeon]
MRAAFFAEHGDLTKLQVGEVPDPAVGPGDVRVRVKACALNHLDLFVREGWPGLKLDLPHIGGTDLAGVVESIGEAVTNVQVGDEVLVNPGLNFAAGPDGEQVIPPEPFIVGENRAGGLAEFCVVPATHVLPKPDGISWEEAACLPLTLQTAFQMLRRGGLAQTGPDLEHLLRHDAAKPATGKRVLVIGGGGGVSVMAIQLAKALGAWVCATTGGPEKAARVADLGADHAIDYKADEAWWKSAFVASEKSGYDVVIDSVGAATWAHSLRCLKAGGRLVTCGATTGPIGETHIQLVFWKQLQIIGSTMGTPEDLQRALAFVASGAVHPIVDSVWPLDEAREAQAHMEAGSMFGKIVLRP